MKKTPAIRVIAAFNGVNATAHALNIDPSTVCKWKVRGGNVPTVHHKKILKKLGRKICKRDLTQQVRS